MTNNVQEIEGTKNCLTFFLPSFASTKALFTPIKKVGVLSVYPILKIGNRPRPNIGGQILEVNKAIVIRSWLRG